MITGILYSRFSFPNPKRSNYIGNKNNVKTNKSLLENLDFDPVFTDEENLIYIEFFLKYIKDFIKIEKWKNEYRNPYILDGEQWEIKIFYDDKEPVEKIGINAYPKNFRDFDKLFNELLIADVYFFKAKAETLKMDNLLDKLCEKFDEPIQIINRFVKAFEFHDNLHSNKDILEMINIKKRRLTKFNQATKEALKFYVYLLIDPLNNQVFYVGKGNKDRVFDHEKNKLSKAKINRIKEIQNKGYNIIRKIVHHGLTEKEAVAAEATLINFIGLNNLTNEVSGHHVTPSQTVEEIDIRLGAKSANVEHNVVVFKINGWDISKSEEELYNETRGHWKASFTKVKKVKYVFSLVDGIIRGVYKPLNWFTVDPDKEYFGPNPKVLENQNEEGRVYFNGVNAPKYILNKYINKKIDNKKILGQNPVVYLEKEV